MLLNLLLKFALKVVVYCCNLYAIYLLKKNQIKVENILKELINAVWVFAIGSLGALARLIHTKPNKITLLIVLAEMVIGGFVSYLTYCITTEFLGIDHSKAIVVAGIAAVMSREVLTLIIKVSKKEINTRGDNLTDWLNKK